jgi:hypothetical protein
MPVDARRWKEVWDACPWATAFASPLWHAVTAEIQPEDASFEWKGIITPLRKIKLAKGLLKGYESSIPGVAAGPISAQTPDEGKVADYWEKLKEKTHGRFLVHMRADSPFCRTSLKTVKTASHVLRIKDREEILTRHHKRQIKKAEKRGMQVLPARREDDFDAYCQMYAASLKRWNRKPARVYSREFFDRIREIMVSADAASFWIVWDREQPQGGALVVYENQRAIYWHGCTAEEPAPGTGHLLHYKIMQDAERRGVERYEFGPSPGLEGVKRFKQGFGAELEQQITVIGPARMFSFWFLKKARK